jgi:hypothetical protein
VGCTKKQCGGVATTGPRSSFTKKEQLVLFFCDAKKKLIKRHPSKKKLEGIEEKKCELVTDPSNSELT